MGTHVGTLAIPLSKRCRHVTAIEANPRTFELLELNALINRAANLTLHNFAASNKAGEIPFLLSRANSGGSKIVPKKKSFKYYYDNPEEVVAPSFALDEKLSGERFDTIVIDIEGSEYFALRGMPLILGQATHLVIEFVPHHLRDVSGVSVEQFLECIGDFDTLTLPSLNRTVSKSKFFSELNTLYESGESDDGLIFSRLK